MSDFDSINSNYIYRNRRRSTKKPWNVEEMPSAKVQKDGSQPQDVSTLNQKAFHHFIVLQYVIFNGIREYSTK